MVAQELDRLLVRRSGHALPEGQSHLWVVAGHSGDDQADVVGLVLVVARVFQVSEAETLSGDGLYDALRVLAHAEGTEYGGAYLCAILLFDLVAHLLGGVLGYSVGYLMAQDDGQRALVLRDGQQTLIHHDLAARHAPCIDLLVGNEVKLPLEILHFAGQTVGVQILRDGVGQLLSNTLHHSSVGSVGGALGLGHKLFVLLGGQRQHFAVAHHQCLLAPRNGHCRCGAATNEDGSHERHQDKSYFSHNAYCFRVNCLQRIAWKGAVATAQPGCDGWRG